MFGAIGVLIRRAENGDTEAQKHVNGVFCKEFRRSQGWLRVLNSHIPGGNVRTMLSRADSWGRGDFQALFIACWIFHPTEKGAYMLRLDAAQGASVNGAFDRLIGSGELQSRRSSHLSVAGAGPTGGSAHRGWKFLKGYEELLIQKEGTREVPYLFLKCEGAPMSGLANTVEHGVDWAYKSFAGHGKCYSPALHNLAKNHPDVDLRAAENFGKRLEKLHSQLGLNGGTMITIGQVVDELCSICGQRLPEQVRNDTHTLANWMLDPKGLLMAFRIKKDVLMRRGVKYDDKAEAELRKLAQHMRATSASHPNQHYREVRLTADDLTGALEVFEDNVHANPIWEPRGMSPRN